MKQKLTVTIEVEVNFKDDDDYLNATMRLDNAISDILLNDRSFSDGAIITTDVVKPTAKPFRWPHDNH